MHRRKFLRNTAAGLGGIVAAGKPARVAAETSASADETASAPGKSGLTFSTGFEGGSLGKIIRVTDTYTRCILLGEVDQFGRNRQISWYYFRIDNAPDSELTIDFTDIVGEYNFRPGAQAITPDTPPVYSYDNHHWTHVSKKNWTALASSMRLRIRPTERRLWIAHVPPYTNRNLARLLESIKRSPELRYEVIGKSVQGRDIPLLTITDPGRGKQQKKVVWLMFRQHSWEGGSSWVSEGAIRFLLSSDPAAARIRRETVFKILPMQDPDGVFRGGVRYNAYGYDLNRNWDTDDPVKMPEITAACNSIADWTNQGKRTDFFLSLHNDEENEYLSPPLSPKFSTLGQKIYDELTRTTSFDPSRAYEASPPQATPPAPGRMQVNEGLYSKLHIPAFLMEQRVAYSRKLGRWPTVDDRLEFGKGLVKAIRAALA
ncbi:MAG TPA: M14-type cytosolic carboxypeptidase [Terriglobia bacterium]|nr:M14-type cytosolic carboxypeptidase [Terriglobia bacterium]